MATSIYEEESTSAGDLNDGEDGSPPQLRTDLLNLHPLAMAVVNRKARNQVAGLLLFSLALLGCNTQAIRTIRPERLLVASLCYFCQAPADCS